MPHISLPEGLPGITSAFAYRPETAVHMRALVEELMREMIATYVSTRNNCHFCQASHRAAAANHLDGNYELVDAVRNDPDAAEISTKLKKLLRIAGKVQISGKEVTPEDVEAARKEGATDREIHDTVLIAAAFSMFNRYVDGLATFTPVDHDMYDVMGKRMAHQGYVRKS